MTPAMRRSYNNNQNWLPTFFNDFFDNDWMLKANATAPAINVIENEKDYKVELAAPGMTKEDFNIQLGNEGELTITMEKKSDTKEEPKEEPKNENKKYLRREFSYTKFQQSFVLPDDVDKAKISASVNDGVLTIDLPKQAIEEKANASRAIEIH